MLTLIFGQTQISIKKALKGIFNAFLNQGPNTYFLFDFLCE